MLLTHFHKNLKHVHLKCVSCIIRAYEKLGQKMSVNRAFYLGSLRPLEELQGQLKWVAKREIFPKDRKKTFLVHCMCFDPLRLPPQSLVHLTWCTFFHFAPEVSYDREWKICLYRYFDALQQIAAYFFPENFSAVHSNLSFSFQILELRIFFPGYWVWGKIWILLLNIFLQFYFLWIFSLPP